MSIYCKQVVSDLIPPCGIFDDLMSVYFAKYGLLL